MGTHAGRWILAAATSLALSPAPVLGQASPDDSPTASWLHHALGAVYLQVGSFGYDPDPQLPGLDGAGTWSLGLSLYPGAGFSSHFAGFDFHVWGVDRSYPSFVAGAAEARTSLTTTAFALGGRIGLPVAWPMGLSLLGGLSYVDHVMKVGGQPAWFLPGIGQTWEEEDGGWAPYWGLATEVRLGVLAFGIEKRWLETEASFEDPFALEQVALGGSPLLVTVTWYPSR